MLLPYKAAQSQQCCFARSQEREVIEFLYGHNFPCTRRLQDSRPFGLIGIAATLFGRDNQREKQQNRNKPLKDSFLAAVTANPRACTDVPEMS